MKNVQGKQELEIWYDMDSFFYLAMESKSWVSLITNF